MSKQEGSRQSRKERNDRLGLGAEKMQDENVEKGRRGRVAKGRVGRNDRLSQGSGEEVEK